jgi:hypothetical protein
MFYLKKQINAILRLWTASVVCVFVIAGIALAYAFSRHRESEFVEQTVVPPPVRSVGPRNQVESLKRVNDLCANLPKPEEFDLINNGTVVSSFELSLLRYAYKSDRGWDEIMPTFLVWLNENGWKSIPSSASAFTKHNQTIAFSTVAGAAENYEIYCSEKNAEDVPVSFAAH